MAQTHAQLSLLGGAMALAEIDRAQVRGEVFTREWVVNLILDLVGYTSDRDLGALRLVEPACGRGAFLGPALQRLVDSCKRSGRDLGTVDSAITAFDVDLSNAESTRTLLVGQLQRAGLGQQLARDLVWAWVSHGDFLLRDHALEKADVVVGNPPYVRLEAVPRDTMIAYRERYPTMRGRSDIYVGFLECSLRLLASRGVLGFICADRWMRNQYGARLRELISAQYSVETVMTMHEVDAFADAVSAYPAIVVLRNGPQGNAAVVETNASFTSTDVEVLNEWRKRSATSIRTPSFEASRLARWHTGVDLWPTGSPAQIELVTELEGRFQPLEDPLTGTRVGIGVATGCDDIFVTQDPDIVEPDRLLSLLQAADTTTGSPKWSGSYLVNPWNGSGLVQLDRFPKLRSYFHRHGDRLRDRHIAKRRPASWYRTIDRVDASLHRRPKLLLPDLKAASHPVLDLGQHYPHHNLYYVVSDTWDLDVLGGLLLSDVANLFVGTYCVKMRGGCYRFQAQYLRRIRVPDPRLMDRGVARELTDAFQARDRDRATIAAADAYGLDSSALRLISPT